MQPLHTLCRRIGNFVLLFGAMPDLHYINGPDTLPPPLTPQEEQQALCGLAAGEGAARDALITHNLRLVVYIAKKFESSTAGVEDMISIGTIGLIKAVNTFEPGKNIKLATYASRCIENELRMHFRRLRRGGTTVSLQETLEAGKEDTTLTFSDVLQDSFCMEEICERQEDAARLRQLIEVLPARERKLILLRYGMAGQPPLTQLETAQLLQISRSYVSRLETHALEQLRKAWHS